MAVESGCVDGVHGHDLTDSGRTVARIALALPVRPTSGDILGALAQAERAGYERCRAEIRAGGPFDDEKYAGLRDEARAERRGWDPESGEAPF